MKTTTLKIVMALLFCTLSVNAQMPSLREGKKKVQKSTENLIPLNPNVVIKLNSNKSLVNPISTTTLEKYRKKKIETDEIYVLKNDETLTSTEIETIKNNSIPIDTTDVFFYDYNCTNKTKLEKEIKDLKAKKGDKDYNSLIKQYELKKSIDEKAERLKLYEDLLNKNIKDDSDPHFRALLPSSYAKKYKFYDYMYSANTKDSISFINNSGIQIGDKTTTVEAELVSSFMGPFRISFGTLVANSNTDSSGSTSKAASNTSNATTSAFQRLRANGGNTYLNLDYPLLCVHSPLLTLYLNMYSKGSLVFTNVSNDVDTTSGNGSTGINLYGSAASDDKKFIFFINGNFGYHYGSTEYYEKLNLSDNKAFGFGQLTAGFNITKLFRVAYTFKTLASDKNLRTDKGVLGIQFLIP